MKGASRTPKQSLVGVWTWPKRLGNDDRHNKHHEIRGVRCHIPLRTPARSSWQCWRATLTNVLLWIVYRPCQRAPKRLGKTVAGPPLQKPSSSNRPAMLRRPRTRKALVTVKSSCPWMGKTAMKPMASRRGFCEPVPFINMIQTQMWKLNTASFKANSVQTSTDHQTPAPNF